MARFHKNCEKNTTYQTPELAAKSDIMNASKFHAVYLPFEDGDAVGEWPKDDDGVEYRGLDWLANTPIGANAGEQFHYRFRSGKGRIEGYQVGGGA